jgi:hypothetical protein
VRCILLLSSEISITVVVRLFKVKLSTRSSLRARKPYTKYVPTTTKCKPMGILGPMFTSRKDQPPTNPQKKKNKKKIIKKKEGHCKSNEKLSFM